MIKNLIIFWIVFLGLAICSVYTFDVWLANTCRNNKEIQEIVGRYESGVIGRARKGTIFTTFIIYIVLLRIFISVTRRQLMILDLGELLQPYAPDLLTKVVMVIGIIALYLLFIFVLVKKIWRIVNIGSQNGAELHMVLRDLSTTYFTLVKLFEDCVVPTILWKRRQNSSVQFYFDVSYHLIMFLPIYYIVICMVYDTAYRGIGIIATFFIYVHIISVIHFSFRYFYHLGQNAIELEERDRKLRLQEGITALRRIDKQTSLLIKNFFNRKP